MKAHCSRCVGARLQPRSRDGIEIDVCPSCRGVWLDRGELEKLLALAAREGDGGYASEASPSSRRGGGYGHEGPPSSSRRGEHHGQRRKRGLLATLGDLFD